MRTTNPPSTRTLGAVLAVALVLVAAVALIAGSSPAARAATASQLRLRISAGQGRVSALAGDVSSANHRARKLAMSASALQAQIDRIQADLDAKRAELLKLRSELDAARTRLAQLEAAQAHAESVLAQQLVGSYEAYRPDLVSVVLEATGFTNLLERISFEQQIGKHNALITGRVRAARRAVAAQATRLGALTVRQQKLTVQVLNERNSVARSRIALVSAELATIRVRNAKAGQLSAARAQVGSLHSQLAKLEAAQQHAAAAQNSQGSSSPGSGSGAPPQSSSSGGFTFPLPKSAASPPGTWSLDDGVDIAAPGGTPELAVCSGTVVLHGIGGFGPSAPVLHCDSPLGGYDYVYYGHAGPGNWTPVGAHVSAGQVISEVGYGIVGISTGPHVEMGFADSSGSPIGPSSAPEMMSLLQAAYGS